MDTILIILPMVVLLDADRHLNALWACVRSVITISCLKRANICLTKSIHFVREIFQFFDDLILMTWFTFSSRSYL